MLLLTSDFFEDKDVVLALEYSVVKGNNVIVGVDPLPVKEMVSSKVLKMLLSRTNLIEYPQTDEGREQAMERIRQALSDSE